jgi:hypothetical protein
MIEVDPRKLANQTAIEANQAHLLKYLGRTLDAFATSLENLPLSFRQILKKLQDQVFACTLLSSLEIT